MGALKNRIQDIFRLGTSEHRNYREQAEAWENVLVGSEGKIKVTIPIGTVVVNVISGAPVMNAAPIECDVDTR